MVGRSLMHSMAEDVFILHTVALTLLSVGMIASMLWAPWIADPIPARVRKLAAAPTPVPASTKHTVLDCTPISEGFARLVRADCNR